MEKTWVRTFRIETILIVSNLYMFFCHHSPKFTKFVMAKCTQMFNLLLISIYISVYEHTDSYNGTNGNLVKYWCHFMRYLYQLQHESWVLEKWIPLPSGCSDNRQRKTNKQNNFLAFSTSTNAMSVPLASRLKCNKKNPLIKADRYGILKLVFIFYFSSAS